ncbi:MAG TPA: Stp1/IreP family PP2C-type Ser/Thr phosphatase [Candidatus Eremiobacteraeota bacterium]|nr:MAG: Serine/threonine phosphatase stp [bacterium ADurb.Bin363]HPZ07712.1 Stp1/IreP family PP2C-type Ser/Thr phosphatase [Candidatus Eremiobacteraeota bacterium]
MISPDSTIEKQEESKITEGNDENTVVEKKAYIRIRGSMRTDVGKVREINQDSMLTMQLTMNECSEFLQPRLFIVADGMGGMSDGEVASSLAIRHVTARITENLLKRNCDFPVDIKVLSGALEYANEIIYNYAREDPSREGMGSTITAGLLIGNRLLIGHVGDTRAYLINTKEIRQITEDHSLVNRLLKMGQLTPEQAQNYPHKNLIYRSLGPNHPIEIATYEECLNPGDIILICCDGLWDYFSNEEFHQIITSSTDFDKITAKLVNLANERGGKDNITLIIFQLICIDKG